MNLNITDIQNTIPKKLKNQVLSEKLTVAEAAKIKQVAKSTIYSWINNNKINVDTTVTPMRVIVDDKFHNAQPQRKSQYKKLEESYAHDLRQLYAEIERLGDELAQKEQTIRDLQQQNDMQRTTTNSESTPEVIEATFEVNGDELPKLLPMRRVDIQPQYFSSNGYWV